ERAVRRRQLALAAVDEDEIRKRSAELEQLSIPAENDFVHRREVILMGFVPRQARDALSLSNGGIRDLGFVGIRVPADPEFSILPAPHAAVFAHDHRRDRIAAL